MIEQTSDYRFNPNLHRECRHDISSLCAPAMANQHDDRELEGKVIQCLKVNSFYGFTFHLILYISCNYEFNCDITGAF